jgi:hypothetical protein
MTQSEKSGLIVRYMIPEQSVIPPEQSHTLIYNWIRNNNKYAVDERAG